MKNKIGFVPKKYDLQPSFYKKIDNSWNAVFIDANDTEYHLSMVLNAYAFQNDYQYAEGIEILRQSKNGRFPIDLKKYTTIKDAMNKLNKIFIK